MKRTLLLACLSLTLAACANPGPSEEDLRIERETFIASVEKSISTRSPTHLARDILELQNSYAAEIGEGGELADLYKRAKDIVAELERQEKITKLNNQLDNSLRLLDELKINDNSGSEDIRLALVMFEAASMTVKEAAAFEGDKGITDKGARLRSKLSSTQQRLLPAMRRRFGKIMSSTLWEHNVEVVVQGGQAKTVRFIAGMFASNSNIAEAQRANNDLLRRLRFKRVQYEWYRGSEYTYYTLDTEPDGKI